MKHLVGFFLLLWFPWFAMAAQVINTQMQLASLTTHSTSNTTLSVEISHHAEQTSMAHCHMSGMESQLTSHHPSTLDSKSHTHHDCKVCGFCVVSNGVAQTTNSLPQFAKFNPLPKARLTVHFHTQTYPPAVKPPILV